MVTFEGFPTMPVGALRFNMLPDGAGVVTDL